ncbi:fungal-specific transcription factor domain-containing protein [Cubamyces lactineus]|nr:fungal-specific transcription factor domain-containing protein [Cubamyces lactineus]
MATQVEGVTGPRDTAKRPKLQRACDLCRKKKIRCDGSEMPNNRCSKCISYDVDCTYDVVNKRPPTKSYVEILESRLQKMEELVDRLQPRSKSPQAESEIHSISNQSTPHSPIDHSTPATSASTVIIPSFNAPSPSNSAELDPSDDEMEASQKLISSFRKFKIRPKEASMRYHGKSSSMMLLRAAVDMRAEFEGVKGEEFVMPPPETGSTQATDDQMFQLLTIGDDLPPYTDFPPPELMRTLIDAYFENMNIFVPILHRPTLEKGIAEGLHLRDEGFGAVVLLVCANGSGWMEDPTDPRLLDAGSQRLPGAKWFLQVERARRSVIANPRLYDLQKCVLMAHYMGSFGTPHSTWTLVGLGLRMAQDVGVHRRKTYGSMKKAEGELWKRAFWSLLTFDRIISSSLGRQCALQDEDFDVDPLIECDDEYWDTGNPETDFKQPEGKPSKITFLNCFNRLLQISAFCSRTLYSINKSKLMLGFVGHEWEERIVAELDSALNKWIDTVPDFLRWDPHRGDVEFLGQSAALHTKYYQLQIFVHRPFLPFARKSTRLTFPSLAICTNAARSLVHVCDVQFKRTGKPLMHNRVRPDRPLYRMTAHTVLPATQQMGLFTAGVVLLINMWSGKKAGLSSQSAVEDVQKCMAMLELLKPHSYSASRLWQVLDCLFSAGDFKSQDQGSSRKRARDVDSSAQASSFEQAQDISGHTGERLATMPASSEPREKNCMPTQGVVADTLVPTRTSLPSSHPDSNPRQDATMGSNVVQSFNLPVRTEELGRIPFNYGFSPSCFDATYQQNSQAVFDAGAGSSSYAPLTGQLGTTCQSLTFERAGYTQPPTGESFSMFDFSHLTQPHVAAPPSQGPRQDFGVGVPELTVDDLALAGNALEMWSTAPASMDWADWRAFVSNVSGAGMGDAFMPEPRNPPAGY